MSHTQRGRERGDGSGGEAAPRGQAPLARVECNLSVGPTAQQHGHLSSALFAHEIPGDSPQSCSGGSNPVSQQDNSALTFR